MGCDACDGFVEGKGCVEGMGCVTDVHPRLACGGGMRCGGCGGSWAGMHWKGGGGTPLPPSRAPSLCPATVPLTPGAGLNGFCNRQ